MARTVIKITENKSDDKNDLLTQTIVYLIQQNFKHDHINPNWKDNHF